MTNNMSNPLQYLVTLTPPGKFVFGDAMQGEYGNKKNYFMRSLPFQQQTGVLGFVRHKLLLQNELLTEGETGINSSNKMKADELIGKNGFNGTDTSFGIINKISPMFIYDGTQHYFLRDKEICNGRDVVYNPATDVLEHYEVKKEFETWFVSERGCKRTFEDIFIKQTQTGIRMNNKQVDDNAYYMQMSYKMKPGFSFGFYVSFDMDVYKKLKYTEEMPISDSLVYTGKENSVFKMNVKSKEHSEGFLTETYKSEPGSNKYLCISDVIAENDFIEKCKLVVGETISFQYRETTNEEENHYGKPDMAVNRKILKRGSVIYTTKEHIAELAKKTAFYNIGYNFVVPVKNKITE